MKSLLLTGLIIAATFTNAQCPAPGNFIKVPGKKGVYSVNSQSRAGSIKAGDTYEMAIIAQSGFDYRLSTQIMEEAPTGALAYEIYELVVEKVTEGTKTEYKKVKKVLATSGAEGAKPLEFSTDKSRKIFISVTMNGGDPKKPQCVGVLVEDKKAVKLGF